MRCLAFLRSALSPLPHPRLSLLYFLLYVCHACVLFRRCLFTPVFTSAIASGRPLPLAFSCLLSRVCLFASSSLCFSASPALPSDPSAPLHFSRPPPRCAYVFPFTFPLSSFLVGPALALTACPPRSFSCYLCSPPSLFSSFSSGCPSLFARPSCHLVFLRDLVYTLQAPSASSAVPFSPVFPLWASLSLSWPRLFPFSSACPLFCRSGCSTYLLFPPLMPLLLWSLPPSSLFVFAFFVLWALSAFGSVLLLPVSSVVRYVVRLLLLARLLIRAVWCLSPLFLFLFPFPSPAWSLPVLPVFSVSLVSPCAIWFPPAGPGPRSFAPPCAFRRICLFPLVCVLACPPSAYFALPFLLGRLRLFPSPCAVLSSFGPIPGFLLSQRASLPPRYRVPCSPLSLCLASLPVLRAPPCPLLLALLPHGFVGLSFPPRCFCLLGAFFGPVLCLAASFCLYSPDLAPSCLRLATLSSITLPLPVLGPVPF